MNAAQAKIYGLEIDFAAIPMQGLTIAGTLGLLHTKYTEFKDPLTGADISYLNLRRAPKVSGSLSASYQWTMLAGISDVHADYHYLSSYENTFLNTPQGRNGSQNIADGTCPLRPHAQGSRHQRHRRLPPGPRRPPASTSGTASAARVHRPDRFEVHVLADQAGPFTGYGAELPHRRRLGTSSNGPVCPRARGRSTAPANPSGSCCHVGRCGPT